MATIGGPNVERGGLVFGYDTGYGVADNGTATRYYPGKPTSNSLETDANWTYEGTNLTSPDDFPVPLPKGVKFHIASKHNSINWTDACRNYTDSYAAGTNITVSGWHMFHSTDTSMTMNGRNRLAWHYSKDGVSTYGGTIYTATEWNKWYYFSHTFSSTGVTTNLRVEDGGYDYYLDAADAAKTTQYYCNLQIEVGTNIPSPYTLGTRSSTQSLIDLKRTTDIDVSNISFDSTGQPEFDGTNDAIQLPTSLVGNLSTAELTVEAVVYHTAWGGASSSRPYIANWNTWNPTTPNQRGFILRTFTTEQFPRFWYCWGASYANVPSSTSMSLNQFHHVVGVFKKDSYAKIYLDGVETGNTTSGTGNHLVYDDTIGTRIGYGTINTGRFVGELPIIKIYNQALSAQEVKQNYNAYKSRFNI